MIESFRYKCLVCPSMGFALRGVDGAGRGGECSLVAFVIRASCFFLFCRIILSQPFRPASARDLGRGVAMAKAGGSWAGFPLFCAVRFAWRYSFSVVMLGSGPRALRGAGGSAWVLVMYLFFGAGYVGADGASSLLPLFGGGASNSFLSGCFVASWCRLALWYLSYPLSFRLEKGFHQRGALLFLHVANHPCARVQHGGVQAAEAELTLRRTVHQRVKACPCNRPGAHCAWLHGHVELAAV